MRRCYAIGKQHRESIAKRQTISATIVRLT